MTGALIVAYCFLPHTMTQDIFPANSDAGTRSYLLEMLGFQDAERELLASTFRLTGRRAFSYVEPSSPTDRPDIYLVNAVKPQWLIMLKDLSPNVHAPAVLIG